MEVVGEIVEDLMMLAQQVDDSTSSTDVGNVTKVTKFHDTEIKIWFWFSLK